MSKRWKPPVTPPIPTTSDDPGTPDDERVCWQFTPEEQNLLVVEKLSSGDEIFGTEIDGRIHLSSGLGFFGYVPKSVAGEIIAFSFSRRVRLIGIVISNDAENLIVELCALR